MYKYIKLVSILISYDYVSVAIVSMDRGIETTLYEVIESVEDV